MKITIDTKEDSPEEIRKAIRMLSSLVEGHKSQGNIFEDTSPGVGEESESRGSAFGSMFGDDTGDTQKQEDKTEEESPDKIQIVEY